jgi:hypothetical protein
MRLVSSTAAIVPLIFVISSTPAAPEPRFTRDEEGTVVRQTQGMETGSVTEHWKKWGRHRVELTNSQLSMFGMMRQTCKKVIFEDADIITFDGQTHQITRAKNPMYEGIAKNMQDEDGVAVGEAMMSAMGAVDPNKTASYAGETCNIYLIENLGQQLCMTEDGITLWSQLNMMNMTQTQTAIDVRRGDPGPDEAYQASAAGLDCTVEAGAAAAPAPQTPPDLDQLMQMIQQGQPQ